MEIKYNFPALLQAADDCKSAVGNLNSELTTLEGNIKNLVATWEGDAQAAYHTRQTEWKSAADDLSLLLGKIEKALRESAMKMQERERANKAKFQ